MSTYERKEKKYDNGQIKYQFCLVDGKIHGDYDEYYDNGQLKIHTQYVHGKKEGRYIWYHSDGTIFYHMFHRNDTTHGEYFVNYKDTCGSFNFLYLDGIQQHGIKISKLTKEEKLYYTLKHGVQWL